jgi:hypothetical protein
MVNFRLSKVVWIALVLCAGDLTSSHAQQTAPRPRGTPIPIPVIQGPPPVPASNLRTGDGCRAQPINEVRTSAGDTITTANYDPRWRCFCPVRPGGQNQRASGTGQPSAQQEVASACSRCTKLWNQGTSGCIEPRAMNSMRDVYGR